MQKGKKILSSVHSARAFRKFMLCNKIHAFLVNTIKYKKIKLSEDFMVNTFKNKMKQFRGDIQKREYTFFSTSKRFRS